MAHTQVRHYKMAMGDVYRVRPVYRRLAKSINNLPSSPICDKMQHFIIQNHTKCQRYTLKHVKKHNLRTPYTLFRMKKHLLLVRYMLFLEKK